jgi:hypothetical protein
MTINQSVSSEFHNMKLKTRVCNDQLRKQKNKKKKTVLFYQIFKINFSRKKSQNKIKSQRKQ